MATSKSGVTDQVDVHLNDPGPDPAEGSKGPGDQWDDPDARNESGFVEATDTPKGPDPAEWGEDQTEPAPPVVGEGPDPDAKGPDPAQWSDEARAERGATDNE